MIEIKNRFDGAVIRELDTLQDTDLQDADLRNADLRNADLLGANLRCADLYGADLRNADLRNADLRDASLRCANLRCADLQGADLQGADLWGADLWGADLRGAAAVIHGLRWPIYITNGRIRIGCQAHELKAWENFTDHEVSGMDDDALGFWTVNKDWILATCRSITKGD